jgi:hypothetical protein
VARCSSTKAIARPSRAGIVVYAAAMTLPAVFMRQSTVALRVSSPPRRE